MMQVRLETSYLPEDGQQRGGFCFRLLNTGATSLRITHFCYTSMLRPLPDAQVDGGVLQQQEANLVEIAAPAELVLAPGEDWQVGVYGLTGVPTTCSLGPLSAWVQLEDKALACELGAFVPPDHYARGPLKDWPDGAIEQPLALLPWPVYADITEYGDTPLLHTTTPAGQIVHELHQRVFPGAEGVFSPEPSPDSRAVRIELCDMRRGGYELEFGDVIVLRHGDVAGRLYGLISLAQMAHGARVDDRFQFPKAGRILDYPRHGWRGMHLDVARTFFPACDVVQLLDVMAWHKLNRFHWHLTDDEGWRLPVPDLPHLVKTGSQRGPGLAMTSQYTEGPQGLTGCYSLDEVAQVVAHAGELGIEVLPEVDLPGHSTALLTALPHLVDPEEPDDSYHSIQGHANNAVNPGMDGLWPVLETIFDSLCALFPFEYIHLGGDEVAAGSWTQSPVAQNWAAAKGLCGDVQSIQGAFMRRCERMLAARGRKLAGWDEVASGGGVCKDALLFAWQSPEKTESLLRQGYNVVSTPGQHYYLDMVQAAGWDNPGAQWAGVSTPEACYAFEPTAGLAEDLVRIAGVQACYWSEFGADPAYLNTMLFPRLSAVAETGWTPPARKNWMRFSALSHLMPRL